MNKTLGRELLLLGLILVLVMAIGTVLAVVTQDFFAEGIPALAIMLAVVGIVTFFGFLRLPMGGAPGFSDGKMRSALTGALVMTYLVYFSSTIWTAGHPSQADRANELLETLTGLLAIVLPFYFGVTGAVEIAKGRSAPSKDETADQAANGV